MFVVPLMAAFVGAGFAAVVLRQYQYRRRPYQAAWGAALAMFAVASAFEALGIASGWSDLTYKGYYLFGGVLTVGWLAVGTMLVLFPGRAGRLAAALMGVISVAAVIAVAVSSTDAGLLHASVPGRGAITAPATFLPPLTNILGSVILIGGAAYSAWEAWRRHSPLGRVAGTALIAGGALLIAVTHSFAQVRGVYVAQPLGEALGIAVMFAGYLAVEAQRLSLPLLARPKPS